MYAMLLEVKVGGKITDYASEIMNKREDEKMEKQIKEEACYGHCESGITWEKAVLKNRKLEPRPVGGYKAQWCDAQTEQKYDTVSHEEMCDTIEKRFENHDEVARQQLRVKKVTEKLARKDYGVMWTKA